MILVTAANGHLGTLVVQGLLKTIPPSQIVATVRNPAKAERLRSLGVAVRELDYDRPETIRTALSGVEKVLLVSSSEVGKRFPQHRSVIDGAKQAGVKLLVYTSILRADRSGLGLASEHKATEDHLRASGLAYVILRNGWYLENHTENLASALQNGVILGSAQDGKFASASRSDYADAAVTVLTENGHANRIYELAGDSAFTLSELAGEVAKASGKSVKYVDLPAPEFEKTLVGFGVPAPFANLLADSDLGAARGDLDGSSDDLRRLIGRPSLALRTAVEKALRT